MSEIFGILFAAVAGLFFIFSGLFDNTDNCENKIEILSESKITSHKIIWTAKSCGGGTVGFSDSKLILKNSSTTEEVIFLTGEGSAVILSDWATSSVEVTIQSIKEITFAEEEVLSDGFKVVPKVELTKF